MSGLKSGEARYRCRFCGIAYYSKNVNPCCCAKALEAGRSLAIEEIVKNPLLARKSPDESFHAVDVHSASEWLRAQIRHDLARGGADLPERLHALVAAAFADVYGK